VHRTTITGNGERERERERERETRVATKKDPSWDKGVIFFGGSPNARSPNARMRESRHGKHNRITCTLLIRATVIARERLYTFCFFSRALRSESRECTVARSIKSEISGEKGKEGNERRKEREVNGIRTLVSRSRLARQFYVLREPDCRPKRTKCREIDFKRKVINDACYFANT